MTGPQGVQLKADILNTLCTMYLYILSSIYSEFFCHFAFGARVAKYIFGTGHSRGGIHGGPTTMYVVANCAKKTGCCAKN